MLFTRPGQLPAIMRPYERNGLHRPMRRVPWYFLDRGELQSLMDAESAFYARRCPTPVSGPDGHHGGHDSDAGSETTVRSAADSSATCAANPTAAELSPTALALE